MKKGLFIICMMLFGAISSFAQDLITTKDGTDIEAKILEVSTSEIKYKKFSNIEGPTFTLPKSDILIVRYENGENEIFNNSSTTNNYTPNTAETVVPGMKYREYKNFYNTRDYVPQPNDPYSRVWAGIASALIPGLGEGVAGEWGRGACFFLGNVGLYGLERSGITYDSYSNTYSYSSIYWVAALARLGLNIWSICDAVHIAKVKNMYDQDIRSQRVSLDLKIEPFVTYTPTGVSSSPQPTAGLAMKLSF